MFYDFKHNVFYQYVIVYHCFSISQLINGQSRLLHMGLPRGDLCHQLGEVKAIIIYSTVFSFIY